MKKLFLFNKQKEFYDKVALLTGIVVVFLFCLTYFVMGINSYVEIHDQLDGEILNYIYQAKYFFSSDDVIPEFMNGMHKSSMTIPAPLGVLFYLFLPPFYAFVFMHLFVLIIGYIGFYLLLKKLTQNTILSIVISCMFICLPFYSVYGLAILGQPLLIWALWQIYAADKLKIGHMFCVFLYAASSSLALIGYVWIGILGGAILYLFIKKKSYKRLLVAFGVMSGTYMITNIELLSLVLGISDEAYKIHREELINYPVTDVMAYFKTVFFDGVSYAFSYNTIIVVLAFLTILLYPILKKSILKERLNKLYYLLLGLFGINLIISLVVTFWHTNVVVSWRNGCEGFIRYFQMDRIAWVMPMIWYIILAICITILLQEKKVKYIAYIGTSVSLILMGCVVCQNSAIVRNWRSMILSDNSIWIDWEGYYATEVYQQIDKYIGKEKSTYRTVSLGIPPAAALYNGFYCLDGYSNCYSLEYKHQFRKIISKELDKLDVLKYQFDQWGNRCYMLNAETGDYMLIDKNNNGVYQNLEFDIEQLKEMGAKYIFAGMKIANAHELGLELMREQPFSTEESYFEVWLYEICFE